MGNLACLLSNVDVRRVFLFASIKISMIQSKHFYYKIRKVVYFHFYLVKCFNLEFIVVPLATFILVHMTTDAVRNAGIFPV